MNASIRWKLSELSVDQCLRLLGTQSLGRLVYLAHDKPQIRPLNYILHQGSVAFRIGYGELLDAIHQRPVLFEVDHSNAKTHTGWSVIVHGTAEEIWRSDELDIVRELDLEPWPLGDRDRYVRVLPTAITGRRVS